MHPTHAPAQGAPGPNPADWPRGAGEFAEKMLRQVKDFVGAAKRHRAAGDIEAARIAMLAAKDAVEVLELGSAVLKAADPAERERAFARISERMTEERERQRELEAEARFRIRSAIFAHTERRPRTPRRTCSRRAPRRGVRLAAVASAGDGPPAPEPPAPRPREHAAAIGGAS